MLGSSRYFRRIHLGLLLAAALAFGCSSGVKSSGPGGKITRTDASDMDAGIIDHVDYQPDGGTVWPDGGEQPDSSEPNPDTGINMDAAAEQPDAMAPGAPDGGEVGLDVRRVMNDYDNCQTSATIDVPIRVNDVDNQATPRSPPLTGFMIPLGRDANLRSLNELMVIDDRGNQLPAQFEALSRYDAHPDDCMAPIRHAYAHVRATPAPGQSEQWRVVSRSNHPGEPTPMSVSETSTEWVIDTGVARFTIDRQTFTGLPQVEVRTAGGYATVVENSRGGFRMDNNGVRTLQAPYYLELERQGPQTAVIAARGYYSTNGSAHGLGYTIILYLYAGSATARIDHAVYYGDVENFSATGASNSTTIGSAKMILPFAAPATEVAAGMASRSASNTGNSMSVKQLKRSPAQRAFRAEITSGSTVLENEPKATSPYLRVTAGNSRVMATLNRMAVREPQGISYVQQNNSLSLEFISEPITVGGARGIWGSAAINFAAGSSDSSAQAELQLHLERPLFATPGLDQIHASKTIGPYAKNTTTHSQLFSLLETIHDNTVNYFEARNISGIQVWPDLSRWNDVNPNSYFDGGENNYWNWSKPGMDEFFRTGENHYLHDFSLSQASLFAETTAFRTYRDNVYASSVAGLAPCYGDSFGWGNQFQEGLNSRVDRCPGDYTYNKHLKLAYLVTADRRFVDFFEEAGASAVNEFGFPPPANPDFYVELTYARLSFQRLENVMNAAEFGRDLTWSASARTALRAYIDTMLQGTLIDGHACWVSGFGTNSALNGTCESPQAWMMPSPLEFSRRAASFLNHTGLSNWMNQYYEVSVRNHTVTGANNHPNTARTGAWNTIYECTTNATGVIESSCRPVTNGVEPFYDNGLLAYYNAFGLLLGSDIQNGSNICAWLPSAYAQHLGVLMMFPGEVNNLVWGKASGQAFQMASQAAGAMDYYCP
ncbi:MAG: hypothetical protein VYC39_08575 [Myxococcota bacterium]|nr:hypothetical protein [Myxococcota bacterium]